MTSAPITKATITLGTGVTRFLEEKKYVGEETLCHSSGGPDSTWTPETGWFIREVGQGYARKGSFHPVHRTLMHSPVCSFSSLSEKGDKPLCYTVSDDAMRPQKRVSNANPSRAFKRLFRGTRIK